MNCKVGFKRKIKNVLPAIMGLFSIVLLWEILSRTEIVPSHMLPSPISVANAFIEDFENIFNHGLVTLKEALIGLGVGIILSYIAATFMDSFDVLGKAFYPIMVITQTIPAIAIAPILVLWMGFGIKAKITLVVLTTFFPITVGVLEGYKCVPKDKIELLESMGAGRWQIFYRLKIPYTLPEFFAGLKISASYSVVAAVIAEWLGGYEGLGVYMIRVKKAYAFDRMFAVIIYIVIISLILIAVAGIIARIAMPWERFQQEDSSTVG